MADLTNLQEAISSLGDDDVEQFLFDRVERRFGRAKLQASDYSFNLILPPGYRVLTPTNWIEGEVTNGGAGQFFWNRLSDYRLMTSDALDAYEKIGAASQAEALRECLRIFSPLEKKCRWIKTVLGSDGFQKWMGIWDSLQFLGDNPLMEYELVTTKYRVPWIRKNVGLFQFPD